MFYLGGCLANMAAWCACSACTSATRAAFTNSSTRVQHAMLFTMSVLVAWLMRDFARPLIEKIPWIMRSATGFEPSDKWFGQQAVYRISMGNFLFFGAMSLALLGVRYKGDRRGQVLHRGNWAAKIGVWLLFSALPFLFPNSVVQAYGWAARFGSGLFLVIQMIILLDFTQTWNDDWAARGEEDERWLYGLLGATLAAYAATLGLSALLYVFFKPGGAGSCSLNVALITVSLLLCVAFSALSVAPLARQGSLFPSAAISLYCTYLCYSALQSEPRDYECNGLGHRLNAASGSTLVIGMLVTLGSVVYSALRAGSNTRLFLLDSDSEAGGGAGLGVDTPLLEADAIAGANSTSAGLDGGGEGATPGAVVASKAGGGGDRGGAGAMDEFTPVGYNYSFFHLIFALASMYIAMLMTGWGAVEQEKDRLDVGWTSVWVKVAAEWVTAALYAWTLAAPALFPDREFA